MAAITHFDIDDVWIPQSTFTVGGTPTDPTTLTVKIKNPAGTITTITENTPLTPTLPIVRVSAGVYKHSGITLDTAGHWYVRFKGTGAAAAAEDHEAIVDPSEFTSDAGLSTRALVTLAEAKDWLNQREIDTSEDLELVRVINDISDRFHQEAEREFKPTVANPATRTFAIVASSRSNAWYIDGDYRGERNSRRRTLDVGDLAAYTAVSIVDTDWTTVLESVALGDIYPVRDWRDPVAGPIRQLEFQADVTTLLSGMRVLVTGTWGFPSVPGNVRQAVLDAVAAVMDRDVEHYRQDNSPVSGAQEGGTVVMVGSTGGRVLALPPTAQAVAWSYRDIRLG